MSLFPTFEHFIEPHIDELRAALAAYPLRFGRDRTPEDWLDCMQEQNPAGLIALHRAFADYIEANRAAPQPDEIWFRDWVWLIADRLYGSAQLPERHA